MEGKPLAAMIVAKMNKAPESPEMEGEEKDEGDLDEYEMIATEILFGVNERDPRVLAKALQSFFALCDSEPHEEGDHLSEGE